VFHGVDAFGESKKENPDGIRSFSTWKIYRYEAHRFAKYLCINRMNAMFSAPAPVRNEWIRVILFQLA
jgi:hypothetical protein